MIQVLRSRQLDEFLGIQERIFSIQAKLKAEERGVSDSNVAISITTAGAGAGAGVVGLPHAHHRSRHGVLRVSNVGNTTATTFGHSVRSTRMASPGRVASTADTGGRLASNFVSTNASEETKESEVGEMV